MTVLQMSLWGTVLIAATVIIRSLALHKIPKNTFLVLWALALTRLLIPYRFHLSPPLSLPDIPLSVSLSNDTQAQSIFPTQIANITDTSANLPWTLLIWAVVLVGLTLYFVLGHLRFRRVYKLAIETAHSSVHEWQQYNSLKRRILKVKVSADISAPLTYGLFCPIILLPKTFDLDNKEQLEHILRHEMVHIKRFDIIWKWLLMITVCVHWFNPLVWVMYVLANRDLEITCDEKVVRSLGENNKATYALTLIELAQEQARIIPSGNAFSKNAIEERAISIMKMRKSRFGGLVISVVAIALLTMATVAFAANGNDNIVENLPQLSSNENQNILSTTSPDNEDVGTAAGNLDTIPLPENHAENDNIALAPTPEEVPQQDNEDLTAIVGGEDEYVNDSQNRQGEDKSPSVEDINSDYNGNGDGVEIGSQTQTRIHPITGEVAHSNVKD